jgi:hypothetical protein
MSIVPTGNPAWVRSNGHTAYGGNVNKVNYQSVGTVNPRTDLSAENLCRIAADLAAVARVSPFAVMTFTCDDTTPAAPTINTYYAMAGSSPTPTRNGNGDVTFQWAGSYADDYGVVANANIIAATATVVTSGANTYVATVELLDANANGVFESVRVRVVDQAVAAVSNAKVCLTIWTG